MSGCNGVCIPLKERLHTDVAFFDGGLSRSAFTATSAIPPKYSPRTLIAVLPQTSLPLLVLLNPIKTSGDHCKAQLPASQGFLVLLANFSLLSLVVLS